MTELSLNGSLEIHFLKALRRTLGVFFNLMGIVNFSNLNLRTHPRTCTLFIFLFFLFLFSAGFSKNSFKKAFFIFFFRIYGLNSSNSHLVIKRRINGLYETVPQSSENGIPYPYLLFTILSYYWNLGGNLIGFGITKDIACYANHAFP